MSTSRHVIGLVMLVSASACYSQDQFGQSTIPEPVQVAGPPGGAIDPGYGYAQQQPQQGYDPQASQGAPQGYPGDDGQDPSQAGIDPNGDPNAMGDGTGQVNDAEIDATLDGYGQWSEDADYGRVWRPDATVVGSDFTPYETAGSWVDTDAGWGYQSDWGWGWLPFHYGRWGWFGGGWGWQPGHQWGPAWVDWRHGGGYVGWRPQGPIGRGSIAMGSHDSQWRFAAEGDLGRAHIRAHEFGDPAEGLRVTTPVTRLGFHSNGAQVHASALMRSRFATNTRVNGGSNIRSQGARSMQQQPTWRQQPASRPQQSYRQPQQSYRPQQQSYRPQQQSYRPTYRPTPSAYHAAPSRSYSAPSHSSSSSSHSSGGGGGGHSSGGGGHHR